MGFVKAIDKLRARDPQAFAAAIDAVVQKRRRSNETVTAKSLVPLGGHDWMYATPRLKAAVQTAYEEMVKRGEKFHSSVNDHQGGRVVFVTIVANATVLIDHKSSRVQAGECLPVPDFVVGMDNSDGTTAIARSRYTLAGEEADLAATYAAKLKKFLDKCGKKGGKKK